MGHVGAKLGEEVAQRRRRVEEGWLIERPPGLERLVDLPLCAGQLRLLRQARGGGILDLGVELVDLGLDGGQFCLGQRHAGVGHRDHRRVLRVRVPHRHRLVPGLGSAHDRGGGGHGVPGPLRGFVLLFPTGTRVIRPRPLRRPRPRPRPRPRGRLVVRHLPLLPRPLQGQQLGSWGWRAGPAGPQPRAPSLRPAAALPSFPCGGRLQLT